MNSQKKIAVDLGHSGSFGSEITKSNHRRMEEGLREELIKRSEKALHLKT